MPLTDEEIKKILQKDIKTKTLLIDVISLEKVIKEHEENGWKLERKLQINGKIKVTFLLVKKYVSLHFSQI